MDPFGASATLHRLAPPGHIFSAYRARKDGDRVGMNVTAYQEKEKNEEMKKGKRGGGEKTKRKKAIDIKEAVCCPSAVVQGAA